MVLRSTGYILGLASCLAQISVAHADWRQDLGTFRIGLSASDSRSMSPADLGNIEKGFAAALGMPVEVSVLRDYSALIDAHVSGRIEYAVYSSTAYASAWLLCQCVEPLAAPVLSNGATGIRSVLAVNASSTFTRLDLNGIKIGVPGEDSVTGLLIPLATYTVGSKPLSKDEPFFKRYSNMQETVDAFQKSEIDGLFAWQEANDKGVLPDTGSMSALRTSESGNGAGSVETKTPWQSELLRFGPHTVRRGMNEELKRLLLAYLQGLDPETLDLIGSLSTDNVEKLVSVKAADYELAIQVAKLGTE